MVRALLICSDDGCEAVYEAVGPLEEVLALACECGCGLALARPEEDAPSGGCVDGSLLVLEPA